MRYKLSLNKILIDVIFILYVIKLTFSYLDIKLGWWLRDLTPDSERYNLFGLSAGFSGHVEYLMFPIILLFILANFKNLGSLFLPFLLTLFLFVLNIFTSFFNNLGIVSSITYTLKLCSPIYFLFVLIIHYKHSHLRLKYNLKKVIIYIIFLSLIALCLFNVSYNRGQERLPVYFSGLHTHNYILSLVFVSISYFLRRKKYVLILFLLGSFCFMFFGYNVRTALIFYFIFISFVVYYISRSFKSVFAFVLVSSPILLGLLFVIFNDFNFDEFSSGRITMYSEKIKILKSYNFIEILFGRGRGSDLVTTTEWWFEKKGSHNDYLTFIIENGIIYTITFIMTIISLLFVKRRVSIFLIGLIIAYLTTSIISNGLALRPLASYLFFIVCGVILTKENNTKENE
tara:strand:+ start:1874 stop:3073 length:1200 start_codon:yes stop_codon:yes gene_type:complete